jgi:hypothetical protein
VYSRTDGLPETEREEIWKGGNERATVLEGGVPKQNLAVWKVPRQCPPVLLVKDLINLYLKDVGEAVDGLPHEGSLSLSMHVPDLELGRLMHIRTTLSCRSNSTPLSAKVATNFDDKRWSLIRSVGIVHSRTKATQLWQ